MASLALQRANGSHGAGGCHKGDRPNEKRDTVTIVRESAKLQEGIMKRLTRRSALALGAGVASILVVGKGAPAEAAVAEKMIAKGVTQRDLGEGPAMIPGYKRVALRDFVVQPGASSPPNAVMKNAMVCHITKGELRVVQDGKEFTAPRNHVWTCAVGTVEHVSNKGKSEAIMRITDLLPS